MVTVQNQLDILKTPVTEKVNSYSYTNSEGMQEKYKWFEINGLKIMQIDVNLSDAEYNSGSTGMLYKTFNIPSEAQIFSNILFAQQNSYAREGGENHLSRIMQNTEIASNTCVRTRWRHDDKTYPRIGRVTVLCIGF